MNGLQASDEFPWDCPAPLRLLVGELVEALLAMGTQPSSFAGVAFHDTSKDALIQQQAHFAPAVREVGRIPVLVDRCGPNEADRIVRQFCFESTRAWTPQEGPPIAALWQNLTDELSDPVWNYYGVANLRQIDIAPGIELAEIHGLRVTPRSFGDLRSLGFAESSLSQLGESAGGVGSSRVVLLAHSTKPKAQETLIRQSDPDLWQSCQRLMTALRLSAPGEVSMGRLWHARRSRFPLGGGTLITGWEVPPTPSAHVYELTPEVVDRTSEIFDALMVLDQDGYGNGPGNLNFAIRSFISSYDRFPAWPGSQMVDLVTALEAVLGTRSEISFRLAFRVAGLLGESHEHRVKIFRSMKRFYSARSELVHGNSMRKKSDLKMYQEALDGVQVLKGYVRSLLAALVVDAAKPKGESHDIAELDELLLSDSTRDKIRFNLRLTGASAVADQAGTL